MPNMLVEGTPYRTIRPLGEGGMAQVWEVEDENTGRRLALKLIHRYLCDRTDLLQRFKSEARVLGRLHGNAHLVEVVASDQTPDGRVYIAMELLKGCALDHELAAQRDEPVAPDVLVPWACLAARHVLAALDASHDVGVLHRDIKPSNVFLQANGVAKLLDFGVAGFSALATGTYVKGSGIKTAPGSIAGTPCYMAPERLRGESADERSDLFAVGVVLWEMLARERAIDEDEDIVAATRIVREGIPPIGSRPGLHLPPALERVVDTATAYDPGDRYPTARAFAEDLLAATRGLPAPAGAGPLAGMRRASAPDTAVSPSRPSGVDPFGGTPLVEAEVIARTPAGGTSTLVSAGHAPRGSRPPVTPAQQQRPSWPAAREQERAYRDAPTRTANPLAEATDVEPVRPTTSSRGAAAEAQQTAGAVARFGALASAARSALASRGVRGRTVATVASAVALVVSAGVFGARALVETRAAAPSAAASAALAVEREASAGERRERAEAAAPVASAAPPAASLAAPPGAPSPSDPSAQAEAERPPAPAPVAAADAPPAASLPGKPAAEDAAGGDGSARPVAAAAPRAAPPKTERKARSEAAKKAEAAPSGSAPLRLKRVIKVEM